MRELTDDEQDAWGEHFYNGEPVSTDDGLCEWCSEVNNGSTYYPFCSMECEEEMLQEQKRILLALDAENAAGLEDEPEREQPW